MSSKTKGKPEMEEAKKAEPEVKPEAEKEVVSEKEFLAYVEDEVKPVAASLGYVITLTKKPDPKAEVWPAPKFRYDPKTKEGKLFNQPAEVPVGWVSNPYVADVE